MNVLDIESHGINVGEELTSGLVKISSIGSYFACDLPYQKFLCEHMMKNIPCIIKSVSSEWNGLKWIVEDKPNFEYLVNSFGDAVVPVANCGDRYYNAQKKEEQALKHYLDYWQSYIFKGYPKDLPCLYLKDWHFTRDFPKENIYRVPSLFASDWLNEYFTARDDIQDDYRFVYMGPKGSWTPLHADVFSSFSWSVNLCGKKRWVFYPPGQEKYLIDKHGNLAYDVDSPYLRDKMKFMNYDKLETSYDIIQNPGEAIFVPSGWHHQVWNMDDTISINHNWVNGSNIEKMWISLQHNLAAVKNEISHIQDMEDWHEHCQLMLNASYGIDYKHFCQFLLYIVHVRLKHLTEKTCLKVYGDWMIGSNHLKFDINQARNILLKLTFDEDFIKLNYFSQEKCKIRALLEKIETVIVIK